jgi:hypothetical protein
MIEKINEIKQMPKYVDRVWETRYTNIFESLKTFQSFQQNFIAQLENEEK